jgi:hypothetical protein
LFCNCYIYIYLLNHGSAETLTTGWMKHSGTNSPKTVVIDPVIVTKSRYQEVHRYMLRTECLCHRWLRIYIFILLLVIKSRPFFVNSISPNYKHEQHDADGANSGRWNAYASEPRYNGAPVVQSLVFCVVFDWMIACLFVFFLDYLSFWGPGWLNELVSLHPVPHPFYTTWHNFVSLVKNKCIF